MGKSLGPTPERLKALRMRQVERRRARAKADAKRRAIAEALARLEAVSDSLQALAVQMTGHERTEMRTHTGARRNELARRLRGAEAEGLYLRQKSIAIHKLAKKWAIVTLLAFALTWAPYVGAMAKGVFLAGLAITTVFFALAWGDWRKAERMGE